MGFGHVLVHSLASELPMRMPDLRSQMPSVLAAVLELQADGRRRAAVNVHQLAWNIGFVAVTTAAAALLRLLLLLLLQALGEFMLERCLLLWVSARKTLHAKQRLLLAGHVGWPNCQLRSSTLRSSCIQPASGSVPLVIGTLVVTGYAVKWLWWLFGGSCA